MRGLPGLFRSLSGGAAAVLVLALSVSTPARAEDGGFFGFLRSLGGTEAPPSAPAAAAPEAEPRLRPLTVRRAKPRAAAPAKARLARAPVKTGPVTIYTDPTLRGGDAVMTKDGVRVFAGSAYAPDRPYTDADFVAVSASKSVNPNLRKTVTDLNKLPHG